MKRSENTEKRKSEILSASLALFVEKGYAGTTVRDLSAATGTSNGLLFHYFPTKEEILCALADRAMRNVGSVAGFLAAGADPLAAFTAITEALLGAFASADGRNLFLLVNQIKTLGSIPQSAKGLVQAVDCIALSVPVIAEGQRRGQFRFGEPLALAVAFWGAVQGIGETLAWYPQASVPDGECLLAILRRP